MPVAVFVLIAAITLLAVFAIERGESSRHSAQLRSRTTEIAAALERRANASSAYLRAGAALLATLDEVPAGSFRRFVTELRLDAENRDSEGIGWATEVRPEEVDAFNALMASQSPAPARLHPVPDGSEPFSVPVTFLAKWKTTAQLVALFFVIVDGLLPSFGLISGTLLWIAAGLTVWTGWQYLMSAWPHLDTPAQPPVPPVGPDL